MPTTELISELLSEGHVLTADHTMEHWPGELHLPGPVWDREAHDKWSSAGGLDLPARANAEVDRLLAAYEPPQIDPAIDAEARAIVRSGMSDGAELPA
jgi:trimethylamine--corrinoid protein Co-methyltransferase